MKKLFLISVLSLLVLLSACSTATRLTLSTQDQWSKLEVVPVQAAPSIFENNAIHTQLTVSAPAEAQASETPPASPIQPLAEKKKAAYTFGQSHNIQLPKGISNPLNRLAGTHHLPSFKIKHSATADGDKPVEEFALVSFILGLISLLGLVAGAIVSIAFLISILAAIAAIILSAVSGSRFRDNPGKYSGKGLRIAGLVMGLLTLILLIIAIILLILFFLFLFG